MHEQTPRDQEAREQPPSEASRLEDALWQAVEQTPRAADVPRIWVGSVEDYLAGTPHGRWIGAAQSRSAVEADIQTMLKRSPHAARSGTDARWHVFSAEGFGDQLGPDTPLPEIVRLANDIRDYTRGFAAWARLDEGNREHHLRFPQTYQGRFDSLHDWVVLQVEQAGYDRLLDNLLPDHLRPHVEINIDSFGHDLCTSGQVITVRDQERGGVWVFDLRPLMEMSKERQSYPVLARKSCEMHKTIEWMQ